MYRPVCWTVHVMTMLLLTLTSIAWGQTQVTFDEAKRNPGQLVTIDGVAGRTVSAKSVSGWNNGFLLKEDNTSNVFEIYTNEHPPATEHHYLVVGKVADNNGQPTKGESYPVFLATSFKLKYDPVPSGRGGTSNGTAGGAGTTSVSPFVWIFGGLAIVAFLFFMFAIFGAKKPPVPQVQAAVQPQFDPNQFSGVATGGAVSAGFATPAGGPGVPPMPGSGFDLDAKTQWFGKDETIFVPDTGQTIFVSDATISVLPPFFEVVDVGQSGEERNGVKLLCSLENKNMFTIGRVDDSQKVSNHIGLRSQTVSRDQGQLLYASDNQCTIVNNADPAKRRNPIVVNGHAMGVGEQQVLQDNDLVSIGEIKLRYHSKRQDT